MYVDFNMSQSIRLELHKDLVFYDFIRDMNLIADNLFTMNIVETGIDYYTTSDDGSKIIKLKYKGKIYE